MVEQIGTPREVFREPASRFVAEFVGSNNILEGRVSEVAGERIRIETPIGGIETRSPANRTLATGDSVELVISADSISFSLSPDQGINHCRCRVVSEEFVGTVITLLVETEGGVELKIQKQQRELDMFRLDDQEILYASWAPEDVYVLP